MQPSKAGAAASPWLPSPGNWRTSCRSWEPWLQGQSGFLGRQLFWDPQRGEATLLIHWASPQAWNAIPPAAVERVQAQFEALAAELSGEGPGNPFPLVFEGALLPQGGTIDVESDHLEQP